MPSGHGPLYGLEHTTVVALPCMPSHRYSCSVVIMGHRLFVAGGAANREDGGLAPSNIVEALSLDDLQWAALKPTTAGRGQFVEFNDVLVTCGGFLDEDSSEITNCVQIYYPRPDRWLPFPPMTTERSGHGLCQHGDRIFALGGWGRQDPLSSVEVMEMPMPDVI